MAQNLMNSEHKATNEQFRKGYDATFGQKDMFLNLRKDIVKFNDSISHEWPWPYIGDKRATCYGYGGDCNGQYCSNECYIPEPPEE